MRMAEEGLRGHDKEPLGGVNVKCLRVKKAKRCRF